MVEFTYGTLADAVQGSLWACRGGKHANMRVIVDGHNDVTVHLHVDPRDAKLISSGSRPWRMRHAAFLARYYPLHPALPAKPAWVAPPVEAVAPIVVPDDEPSYSAILHPPSAPTLSVVVEPVVEPDQGEQGFMAVSPPPPAPVHSLLRGKPTPLPVPTRTYEVRVRRILVERIQAASILDALGEVQATDADADVVGIQEVE